MNSIIRIFSLLVLVFIGCTEKKVEKEENQIKILIEKQIGFEIPDFKEVKREIGKPAFNGDCTNTVILKFKENTNLDNFYSEIKKRVENPQNLNYEKVNGCITLTDKWGVNIHGEYSYAFMSECTDGDDKDFSLVINSKDSTVILSYGYW